MSDRWPTSGGAATAEAAGRGALRRWTMRHRNEAAARELAWEVAASMAYPAQANRPFGSTAGQDVLTSLAADGTPTLHPITDNALNCEERM